MVDPRIYRAAFLPALLAIVVAAFSLHQPPRPLESPLPPDAFLGVRAAADLRGLAAAYPDRRPGGQGDAGLSAHVAHELQSSLKIPVNVRRLRGETIDGERDLSTVIATRPGAPGPGIVVLSHRDAEGRGAPAELSGTAAMLELARVVADGRLRRTITFVSTSGGTGGAAGAADVAERLPGPVSAVLVLGNVAGTDLHPPFVTGFSNSEGQAPLRLRRTVEAAIKVETARGAGAPGALTQWSRLAFPLTVGEQGELGERGLSAVLLQVSGERPPGARVAVSAGELEAFGRAALRSVYALDSGPAISGGPRADLTLGSRVLPLWAVYLVVGMLLLPAFVATLDGLGRIRRRRHPIAMWIPWVLTGALPFVVAGALTVLLGLAGLIDAPGAPIPAETLDFDGAAKAGLAAIVLVFALGWLVRPLVARRLKPQEPLVGSPGAATALAVVACAAVLAVYVVNPFAAAVLVIPLHVWLLTSSTEARLSRGLTVGLTAMALVPAAVIALSDARSLGYDPIELLWLGVLLVAGGQIGVVTWLLWSIVGACGVAATALALQAGAQRATPKVVKEQEPRYVARASRARRPALWR